MKTLRIAIVAICIAALALPAGAAAKNGHGHGKVKGNAARLCKQLRADMGAVAFRSAYASKSGKHNAFGKCVKQTKRTLRRAKLAGAKKAEAVSQAQDECQAELAGSSEEFDSQYGSDEQDADNEGADDQRNDDFAECVDDHADDDQGDTSSDDQGEDGNGDQQSQAGSEFDDSGEVAND